MRPKCKRVFFCIQKKEERKDTKSCVRPRQRAIQHSQIRSIKKHPFFDRLRDKKLKSEPHIKIVHRDDKNAFKHMITSDTPLPRAAHHCRPEIF